MNDHKLIQHEVLETILKHHNQREMDMESFGMMLQEIGLFLMWNSESSNYKKARWKKIINNYIKPFITLKKISGGKYAGFKQ